LIFYEKLFQKNTPLENLKKHIFFLHLHKNGGDRSMIMGHVAHQNDRLTKTYRKREKNVKKILLVAMVTKINVMFCIFFAFFAF